MRLRTKIQRGLAVITLTFLLLLLISLWRFHGAAAAVLLLLLPLGYSVAALMLLEKVLLKPLQTLDRQLNEVLPAAEGDAEQDELQRAASALRQLQEKNHEYQQQVLFLENLADLVSFLDADMNLYYVSQSHKTLLGYDPKALLAKPSEPENFFHPDDMERLASAVNVTKTLEPERSSCGQACRRPLSLV